MSPTKRRKNFGVTATFALVALLAANTDQVLGFSPVNRPGASLSLTRNAAKVGPAHSSLTHTTRRWEKLDDSMDAEVETSAPNNDSKQRKYTNPTPVLAKWMKNNPAAPAAAAAALAMSLALAPLPSEAAMSGGRMGGSFSAPSRSSYSGSLSAPRSYGSGYSRGFSSGYGAGYYSRGPSVFVTPFVNPFPFSPFYSPGYIGGPGVIGYRGPGLLSFLLFGGLALAATSVISNVGRSLTTSWVDSGSDLFSDRVGASALGSGNTVVQVSVAMEVPNRDDPNSILGALDRLARTARTDSRVGIQNLTSQVALELLRRKSSIVSASSSYQHFRDRTKALREFNNRSIKERGKFERETVSKYGGVDYSIGDSGRAGGDSGKATMAVVTLLLTIDGDSTKVPTIRSMSDAEEALRKIAADVKVEDCLQGAEILWTPEDRSETLTRRDVIADYPELRDI